MIDIAVAGIYSFASCTQNQETSEYFLDKLCSLNAKVAIFEKINLAEEMPTIETLTKVDALPGQLGQNGIVDLNLQPVSENHPLQKQLSRLKFNHGQ